MDLLRRLDNSNRKHYTIMAVYDEIRKVIFDKVKEFADINETPINEAVEAATAITLVLMKEAYTSGVNEGSDRSSSFDWGIRRKSIEFDEWLKDNENYLI